MTSNELPSEEDIVELSQFIRKGIDELSSVSKQISMEARAEKISILSDKLSRLRSAHQSFKLEIGDQPRDVGIIF